MDQSLAGVSTDPAARERRRRQVVAGGYPRARRENARLAIVAMGALMPEAIAAGERLEQGGVNADVLCVTSSGLLFEAVQARRG